MGLGDGTNWSGTASSGGPVSIVVDGSEVAFNVDIGAEAAVVAHEMCKAWNAKWPGDASMPDATTVKFSKGVTVDMSIKEGNHPATSLTKYPLLVAGLMVQRVSTQH